MPNIRFYVLLLMCLVPYGLFYCFIVFWDYFCSTTILSANATQGPLKEKSVSEAIKKIMVMDDEDIVSDIAKQMLEYMGYEVSVVIEGREAVNLYRKAYDEGNPYLAVIMDLNIPQGMGGKEAVKEVLQIDGDARVLVSSGNSNDPVMVKYQEYGFCGCIAKPFDLQNLRDSIQSVLQ